jgi:hypothetical protein
MSSTLQRLLADKPSFHAWPDGRPANWSVAPQVLDYLYQQLWPGMFSLETGAGQTTAAFAIAGTHHVAVTPDRAQADRILAYLDGLGIDRKPTFVIESSDTALPAGRGVPERLDLVLVDGAHRFPFPIIDWYYTQDRIPVGGMLVLDDFIMPSVRILYDFLVGDGDWELVKAFQVTAFFRRIQRTENVWDWADQNINRPHLEMIKKREQAKEKVSRPSALVNWARLFKK